ncbi:RNA polymerase-associated protein RapA [Zobellella taiwanensis]|jgi:ATP-dependent helicase HepA|uniref:RNA polymerase-associated protein RapA n=1 Tax=Zobellella taiwanensis TaxID=347535 RepID=A0A2P7QL29_9GAMM|nr:RNA polymerase-associated protein RapA [Zobellella taiwanensis]PSJ38677.1 RNA polymerase-associated protein RapA [Zobellella taiwanensis]
MPFSLGQRWISDTETDLGLGTIVAIDVRMVTMLFPACGENRMYAKDDAPVTRVMFNPGDVISSHEDWELEVADVTEQDGLLTYHGIRVDTKEPASLKETFLNHFIKLNKPQERLFAGQIDKIGRFNLRFQALTHQFNQRRSPLRGLASGRVSLIPHQLHIAREVGSRYAPRVLLADEVGLGKTIEAGMIIQQQWLSGRASRILILVPDALIHQWLVEMLRRFNLHFALFDEERCVEAFADAANPFDTEQLIICSLDFITKKRKRFEQLLDSQWDLLVVDEAHHLVWDPEQPSRAYDVVEALAGQTPGVLLLTATPDQQGHESHFARLRLLDPERFYDYDAFLAEEESYQPLAQAAQALLGEAELDANAMSRLAPFLDTQENTDFSDPEQRHALLARLLDRHGTGRLLFRNTRQAIKGFPSRQLHLHPLPLPNQYKTAIRVAGLMGSQQDTATQALQALYPEDIYRQFEGGDNAWTQFDSRVDWLLEFARGKRNDKILIITARAGVALALEEVLRIREGIRGTVFHEGMTLLERDKAAAYFAQMEGGAQVMICSEIGSEGRNFQFAHQLVLFDLPLNPDLLEQRIGRLDRIGQQHDIDIHVPYLEGTAQQALALWYHQGMNAFGKPNAIGQPVYQQLSARLLELLAGHGQDQDLLDQLIADTQALTRELNQQMELGRDRLLELNSSGLLYHRNLATELAEADQDPTLAIFAIKLFDEVGIHQDDRGENAIVLRPTEQMLVPSFPALPEDGASITFDRDTALGRDDLQFLSWDHPMIRGGIDLVLGSEIGTTAVAILKNKALPVGTQFVELIFVAESAHHAQLYRFLPPAPIRLLLDKNGNDLADKVSFDSFDKQLSSVNRHLASKLVNASQSVIHRLLQAAQPTAENRMQQLVEQARSRMHASLGQELERLQELARINPNVRQSEIEHLQELKAELDSLLSHTRLKLDAIRFIVVSHQ